MKALFAIPAALLVAGCMSEAQFEKAGGSEALRKADYSACWDAAMKEWPPAFQPNGMDYNSGRQYKFVETCMAERGYR